MWVDSRHAFLRITSSDSQIHSNTVTVSVDREYQANHKLPILYHGAVYKYVQLLALAMCTNTCQAKTQSESLTLTPFSISRSYSHVHTHNSFCDTLLLQLPTVDRITHTLLTACAVLYINSCSMSFSYVVYQNLFENIMIFFSHFFVQRF